MIYMEKLKVKECGFRTLVTTLTKSMAEDLTKYLKKMGLRLHICILI